MIKRHYFYMTLGVLGLFFGCFHWLMFRHAAVFSGGTEGLFIFLLAPLVFVLPHTMERCFPLPVSKVLARVGGYWFIFAIYATLFLIPFFLLWCLCMILASEAIWTKIAHVYGTAALALLVFILIYGAWRARHPVRRTLSVYTEKDIPRDYVIAFVSDIHLGMVLDGRFCRKLVENVNEIQPDIFLIGGDLIDGNLGFVIKDRSFEGFRNLHPKLGSYAVFGNHDHYGMDIPLERNMLEECGIRCLQGECVQPAEGLMLCGLEDYLFHQEQDILPVRGDGFSIVIDHEPVRMEQAEKAGYDLYLGGHTHAGQFWPIRYFTKRMFDLDYGTLQTGKLTAIVSSGYGAWGTLFRLGTKPEIVVIHVMRESG